ncbi:MAG: hypothetical protein HQ455_04545 [Burkholderiales bacterium]|jgi:hypothetical protein|nr:hypothetical protein [Burkholderiales bacterium]
MNTKGMTKYLIMAMLMMSINIPLFFYSRSFLSSAQALNKATSPLDTPPSTFQDDKASTEQLPKSDNPTETTAAEDALKNRENPPPLANLYRPPLLGKCKKLFDRFMNQKDPDKPFRAFVYSFDGETTYCAGAVTDKSPEHAERIARKDCEDNQAVTGKYSPCRIYTSEKTN